MAAAPAKYITVETDQRILLREYGSETPVPTMTVSGHKYELDRDRVQAALEGVLPEPIHEHFVVINARRWPPKQVLALVTGLDRADFTTHQARRALTRLGFPAARAAGSRVRHVQAAQAAESSGAAASETGGRIGVHVPSDTANPVKGREVRRSRLGAAQDARHDG